ncbi:RHS repeat-associated core domain-containing protein, partial [Pedobacter sp. GR22-10]|nr:RHS repeat-associated core domain-containing protein [Pedobacter sp. GR22-10]
NAGHTLKMEYGTNTDNEVRLWALTADGASTNNQYYPAGKLYRTTTKDENWKASDGRAGTTDEFKDFEGRVVLKRAWGTNDRGLCTYYVYDDLGNLRYVLPPAVNEGTDRFSPALSSFTESQVEFHYYIYAYRYDGRKRVTEKKIPGKAWEFMVYNLLDQVVMSQDGNQRNKSPQEWSFHKYDALGRVVMTGLYQYNTAVADTNRVNPERSYKNGLQDYANTQKNENGEIKLWEARDNSSTVTGYTSRAMPQGDISAYLSINYYDDYDFVGGNTFSYSGRSQKTKGLATGSRVNVLGSSDMLLSEHFYDEEGRVVKTFSQHYLSGGIDPSNYDETSNSYSFVGELTSSLRIHHTTAGDTQIANRYEYDHMGRKLAGFEEINGKGEVVLSKLDYNELGQLKNKSRHSEDKVNFLQSTGLAYNERGWLKSSINDQFSMQLDYQENNSGWYNGNIGRQYWSAGANP